MPRPKRNTSRTTFLLDQPLFHLTGGSGPEARWRAALNEAEPIDDVREKSGHQPARRPQQAAPPHDNGDEDIQASAWKRLDRTRLIQKLIDPPVAWRRVVMICSGGLGKTTNLEYLEAEINAARRRRRPTFRGKQLAVLTPFDKILLPENGFQTWLLGEFQTRAAATGSTKNDLDRRLMSGGITFLLDSLDQAGAHGPAIDALNALLIGRWSKCPIWVSGRPHAFETNETIFFTGWRFCRIGELDEPECRFLLRQTRAQREREQGGRGPQPVELYDLLSADARRLAQVPRIGRLIGRLPPATVHEKLSGPATSGDVYWEVFNFRPSKPREECGILYDGLKTEAGCVLGLRPPIKPLSFPNHEPTPHQMRRARDLLGAIAFEMLARFDADGKPAPALDGVENVGAFQEAVKRRFIRAGALVNWMGEPESDDLFDSDWKALRSLDSVGLKHMIFSSDEQDSHLRWSDITTLSFFAAYWACRWERIEELTRCGLAWVIDPLPEKATNQEFREFWDFALQMPDVRIDDPGDRPDPARWVALFASHYDVSARVEGHPIRSNEFIYRSWKRMRTWSPKTIMDFQAEFAMMLDGKRGSTTEDRERKILARKLIEGFIPLVTNDKSALPGGPDDGEFTMGDGKGSDNQPHRVKLSHFQLHKFCVTNLEYELFDPRHKDLRWWAGEKHPDAKVTSGADDDCPVVNISWYDVWVYAQWLHEFVDPRSQMRYRFRLPSEAQWEYACRAGLSKAFSFKGGGTDKCTSADCNFRYDDEFGAGAKDGPYYGRTAPVGALGENPWGFCQMHGNVREWCFDWYAAEFYTDDRSKVTDPVNCEEASARVLRGGSWSDDGGYCGSANRNWCGPGDRYDDCGFRLAAVPCVGAKPGKSSE